MGWWKADPVPDPPSTPTPTPPRHPHLHPHPLPSTQATTDPAAACPVDPKTREIWLQHAQSQSKSRELPPSHPPLQSPGSIPTTFGSSKECSSDRIDQSPVSSPPPPSRSTTSSRPLSHDRAISSIPRAGLTTANSKTDTTPANAESETGPHPSGNWIYPSESQFFNAVMRKQSASASPESLASSISTIIPIHNAVNERAWTLIKAWEGDTSSNCGGPKLLSFQGLGAGALSPKARFKSLCGYTEPFDRHDWVVQRCGGEQVEYVIDFYQGKSSPEDKRRPGELSFYLDVRPKLNTWEGWRMRGEKLMGWK